jgi:hypothetical protein
MEDGAEAGLAFDSYRSEADIVASGKELLRVLDAVDDALMPPEDALQPSPGERERFVRSIQESLLSGDCSEKTEPAPVVIRRLNRQEYDNTIRDLFAAELNGRDLRLAQDFPADDIGFGFDNIGSALSTSPVHVERYLQAAERAMQAVISAPSAEGLPPVELIGLRTYPLAPDGVVEFEHHLKPGRYLAEFSLVRAGVSESETPPKLRLGFGKDSRSVNASQIQDETVVYRYWLNAYEGDAQVSVSIVDDKGTKNVVPDKDAGRNVSGDQRYGDNRGLHVDSMVVRGPLPLADEGAGDSNATLFCAPIAGDGDRLSCGRRIVERFAPRAFRRPVKQQEVDRLMRIFHQAHYQGESFERAVQLTLTAALVSPQFVFLVEPDDEHQARELTNYELASRLSYFLWSSMPDEDLFAAARDGTIRSNLRQHVARMLRDAKSEALVSNFVGQWLQLRNLSGISPDNELFPSFSAELARAMRQETEEYFAYVLRNNRSSLELLDSDYTFLNESLANHYSIDHVEGPEFRRVSLSDRNRGGVLTQASVLSLTSNHNRTSPVKRGQWILQQILGTPPPPPPPNVAQLDESPESEKAASLRERLEIHRSSPECASCHNQMDPLGFGLENFDAIGRWRESDGDFAIDASGVLPGNRSFNNVGELKSVLKSTGARRFSWCLIENMLTYSLGRSLEHHDYCTVEGIRRRLVENDYRIQEIVLAIVESDAFQRRGVSR